MDYSELTAAVEANFEQVLGAINAAGFVLIGAYLGVLVVRIVVELLRR